MKWIIILFVITLAFLVLFKFLYFGGSNPILNLSNILGNNSQASSFYVNGSIFSLIFIGDKIDANNNNNNNNNNNQNGLLNLENEKENVNFVDFLTNSLIDIISKGDSSFPLEQVLSNSNITTYNNPDNLHKLLLLNGSWNLDVRSGNIVSFNAKISTINKDGISPHTYEILNLIVNSNIPIKLSQNDVTIIKGRTDILTPNNIKNVDLYLILQQDVMSIILEPKILGDDYNGQPIYGLTNYKTN